VCRNLDIEDAEASMEPLGHRIESGRWMECTWDNDSDLSHLAMVHMFIFVLNGSLIIFHVP
jgi:hypothetical protein